MDIDEQNIARKEIKESLSICNFCLRRIGLSFIDDAPKTIYEKCSSLLSFLTASTLLFVMLAGEYAFIVGQMAKHASIEDFIGSLVHIAGYDTLSLGKLITIFYKRHTFRQLVAELADIWPVSLRDEESIAMKRVSLSGLKHTQRLYTMWNVLGVWLYNLTPIAVLVYHRMRGAPSQLGYVWQMSYPFDKTRPVYHEIVYVCETVSGIMSVSSMLGSDLFFVTMASHIGLLLRLVQVRIRCLTVMDEQDPEEAAAVHDCYDDIVGVVQVHQRLIQYITDLEDAFSLINLINVMLASVNICCVVFAIVFIDPWMEMSNKFYLGAALTQMGIVCWYADDIHRASVGVADAVYHSGWYKSDVRCRKALLVMLQRSQKPLYFTALKFRNITMTTYSSILTTAYSYFTLLYTSYRRDN